MLFRRREFGDFDYEPTDEIGDDTPPIQGLVGATKPPYIPFDKIYAPLIAAKRCEILPGAATRGAPRMAEIEGWANHWTAVQPTEKRPNPCLIVCRDGRPAGRNVSAVPGPLCNDLIGLHKIYVIAFGRANHAGRGHTPLLNELRRNILPVRTAAQRGLQDTGGFGGALGGTEIEHAGTGKALSVAQVHNLIDSRALIAVWYRWPAERVSWHHALTTRRKIDITGKLMPPWDSPTWLRDRVKERMTWASAQLAAVPR